MKSIPQSAHPLSETDAIRAAIVTAARAHVGTRFRHQGRAPGHGLDCVGLVAVVGRTLGLLDYDAIDYGRLPDEATLSAHIDAAGFRPVAVADARSGDVALMRFTRAAQHVGILTGYGLIHAWMQAGRVVEHRLDASWRARLLSVYSFPGVN